MKKAILLSLVIVLLASAPQPLACAATNKAVQLKQLKLINNPLRTNLNRPFRARYMLTQKSVVGAAIIKNKRIVKTLRKSHAQKKGLHRIYWNGRNYKNKTVASGRYLLKIAVRNPGTRKLSITKKIIIVINNSTPNDTPIVPPQTPTPEPSRPPVEVAPLEPVRQLLFYDYFDRPDGLLADEWNADPLGKWKVTSYWMYTKNLQGWTDSAIFRVITQKSDFSNFELTVDMKKMDLGIEDWEGLQLFFRYNDSDNLYVAGIRNDNQVQLKKKANGIYTTLGLAPIQSNNLDTWYKMKIVANGSNLQFYVDEIKLLDVNDSTFTMGKVGIRTDNVETYFDNFEVFSLAP